MWRRAALVGGWFVVATLTLGATAWAGSGSASSMTNRQLGLWRTTPAATTSVTFGPVAPLGARVCAIGAVSATVSVSASGGPMDLRVHLDGGPLLAPGAVTFTPSGGSDVASFTFLARVQPFEANDHHAFQLEWRSARGARVTLHSATMQLLYQEGSHAC